MVDENRAVKVQKFHPILEGLGVALEATFDSGTELEFDGSFRCPPEMIHDSREGLVKRFYHPAIYEGDLSNGTGKLVINFVPWAWDKDEETEKDSFHRLVFRGKGDAVRNAKFARFGEEKAFGFQPGKPFISLDFFGKRSDEFLPLFVLLDGRLVKIEAEISEADVALVIHKVTRAEIPPHLAAACFMQR